jgi:hypothetical protein
MVPKERTTVVRYSVGLALGALAIAGATSLRVSVADDWNPIEPQTRQVGWQQYWAAIERTARMAFDPQAQKLAQARGLNVMNVTWEDTARFQNSAVGPNISDMTIQVGLEDPATRQFRVTAMPVIRYPNFTDRTGDMDPRDFTLLVGNHAGGPLRRVSLYEFLKEPTRYLTNPGSWLGRNRSLLAERDAKVLVSAQACFLPVPQEGIATFNPVLFNYQSVSGDPAVLTILATREGTSVTVIDNKRDAFRTGSVWGQRLFFNKNGERASLTGQRLSDVRNATGGAIGSSPGLSMVLLIQVPLKQKHPMREEMYAPAAPAMTGGMGGGMAAARSAASDVEMAVIGHGRVEGPFTEIDNLSIERDPRYPVRVTVQFYKATSNGVVSEADLDAIKREIDGVYAQASAVGSLVVDGRAGRVTEYDGPKVQPAGWWDEFWRRHEANTGDSRAEAIAKLRRLLGRDYMRRPVTELYLRDLLRP